MERLIYELDHSPETDVGRDILEDVNLVSLELREIYYALQEGQFYVAEKLDKIDTWLFQAEEYALGTIQPHNMPNGGMDVMTQEVNSTDSGPLALTTATVTTNAVPTPLLATSEDFSSSDCLIWGATFSDINPQILLQEQPLIHHDAKDQKTTGVRNQQDRYPERPQNIRDLYMDRRIGAIYTEEGLHAKTTEIWIDGGIPDLPANDLSSLGPELPDATLQDGNLSSGIMEPVLPLQPLFVQNAPDLSTLDPGQDKRLECLLSKLEEDPTTQDQFWQLDAEYSVLGDKQSDMGMCQTEAKGLFTGQVIDIDILLEDEPNINDEKTVIGERQKDAELNNYDRTAAGASEICAVREEMLCLSEDEDLYARREGSNATDQVVDGALLTTCMVRISVEPERKMASAHQLDSVWGDSPSKMTMTTLTTNAVAMPVFATKEYPEGPPEMIEGSNFYNGRPQADGCENTEIMVGGGESLSEIAATDESFRIAMGFWTTSRLQPARNSGSESKHYQENAEGNERNTEESIPASKGFFTGQDIDLECLLEYEPTFHQLQDSSSTVRPSLRSMEEDGKNTCGSGSVRSTMLSEETGGRKVVIGLLQKNDSRQRKCAERKSWELDPGVGSETHQENGDCEETSDEESQARLTSIYSLGPLSDNKTPPDECSLRQSKGDQFDMKKPGLHLDWPECDRSKDSQIESEDRGREETEAVMRELQLVETQVVIRNKLQDSCKLLDKTGSLTLYEQEAVLTKPRRSDPQRDLIPLMVVEQTRKTKEPGPTWISDGVSHLLGQGDTLTKKFNPRLKPNDTHEIMQPEEYAQVETRQKIPELREAMPIAEDEEPHASTESFSRRPSCTLREVSRVQSSETGPHKLQWSCKTVPWIMSHQRYFKISKKELPEIVICSTRIGDLCLESKPRISPVIQNELNYVEMEMKTTVFSTGELFRYLYQVCQMETGDLLQALDERHGPDPKTGQMDEKEKGKEKGNYRL